MKIRAITVALLLLSLSSHGLAQNLAIKNLKIYPLGSREPLEQATLLIQDGLVTGFARDLKLPNGVEVMDGSGLVATPGLFEPHSQLGLEEISAVQTTIDSKSGDHASGPGFDIQYSINSASTLLKVAAVEGITHAITAPVQANDIFAGLGAGISLVGAPILISPRIALFGAVTAESASHLGGSRSEAIAHLYRVFEDLEFYRQQRAIVGPNGQIAGYLGHDKRRYDKINMDALVYVKERGLPVVCHVERANEIEQVIAISREFKLPIVIRGASEGWKVAEQLASHDVPVLLDPMNNLPSGFDRLGARADNATLLNAAGVRVAFTVSDPHNARQLRQLAGNAVANGMEWMAALKAITSVPAEIFNIEAGVIKTGGPATFVLWNGDPLDVTTWASRVMVDGKWLEMSSRQTRLFHRYRDLSEGKKNGFSYQ